MILGPGAVEIGGPCPRSERDESKRQRHWRKASRDGHGFLRRTILSSDTTVARALPLDPPRIGLWPGPAVAGVRRMYRQAATYIDRIIKGAKAAQLPVEQPTHLPLIVSQRSAKLLGLSLPEGILVRADEIIE